MDETARDIRAASFALRIGCAVQCAVLAWLALRHGTSVDSWLFMNVGASEASAAAVDRALAAIALLAGIVLLARSSPVGASAVVLVFLMQAVAARLVGGRAFFELTPAAHATRWLAPLAIVFLAGQSAAPEAVERGRKRAARVLRLAIAATFLAHAWQALRFDPGFVDLLLGTVRRWTAASPSESDAHIVLTAIGSVDVAVAVAILLPRCWPSVALWATVWGLATAASRTVALGPGFVHESLARVLNGLAPFALWLLVRNATRRPSSTASAR